MEYVEDFTHAFVEIADVAKIGVTGATNVFLANVEIPEIDGVIQPL